MKRRRFPKLVSDRQRIIKECLAMLRVILKHERGAKCEICSRSEQFTPRPLSLFHVLDRQRYPNMQLEQSNILLACWVPSNYNDSYCHNIWHHLPGSDPRHQRVEEGVKKVLGSSYRTKLLIKAKCAPKLSMNQLGIKRMCLHQEMKELGLCLPK